MYNKLFSKIVLSSIWLEPLATRVVWIAFLATMDEDGFVQCSAIGNVASLANVSLDEAKEAIKTLESPDLESGNPLHEGRRIERIPGGWLVLNAAAHRELVTREMAKERTRDRVRRHREKQKCNADVTGSNSAQRNGSALVAQSEAEAEAEAELVIVSITPREFFNRWNSFASRKSLASAQRLTDGRQAKIKSRINQDGWFEDFLAACDKLPIPGDGWQPDIDWMVANDSNVAKILEGKYDWRGKDNGKSSTQDAIKARTRAAMVYEFEPGEPT